MAGPQRVEILVASREGRTLETARDLIESMGVMRFLVIANPNDHADLIQLAAEQSTAGADAASTRELRDAEGSVVGRWVTVASNKQLQGPLRTPAKVIVFSNDAQAAPGGGWRVRSARDVAARNTSPPARSSVDRFRRPEH